MAPPFCSSVKSWKAWSFLLVLGQQAVCGSHRMKDLKLSSVVLLSSGLFIVFYIMLLVFMLQQIVSCPELPFVNWIALYIQQTKE